MQRPQAAAAMPPPPPRPQPSQPRLRTPSTGVVGVARAGGAEFCGEGREPWRLLPLLVPGWVFDALCGHFWTR